MVTNDRCQVDQFQHVISYCFGHLSDGIDVVNLVGVIRLLWYNFQNILCIFHTAGNYPSRLLNVW